MNNNRLMQLVLLLVCLPAMLLVSSCGSNDAYFNYKVIEKNLKVTPTEKLEATVLPLEVFAAVGLMVHEDYLIVGARDPEAMMQVFDVNTLENKLNCLRVGRGPGETALPSALLPYTEFYEKMAYTKDGDIFVPFAQNGYASILYEINLSESISQQTKVQTFLKDDIPVVNGTFIILDNDPNKRLEQSITHFSPEIPNIRVVYGDSLVKEIELYSKVMYNGDASKNDDGLYRGIFIKHPNKNIVLQFLGDLDYILKLDIDNDKYCAYHNKESISFADVYTSDAQGGYVDYDCTSDYIFAIDVVKDQLEENKYKTNLYIYDWDLNCIKSFEIPVAIRRIGYDEKNNVLFGLDQITEVFYKINLEGVL